jgi:hypothetical protein
MSKTEIVTGTLIDDHTVVLDKPLQSKATKVRLTIEPLSPQYYRLYRPEVISKIHAAQATRSYQPPSREEVDGWLKTERESWGD